jgi:hypothetical protein
MPSELPDDSLSPTDSAKVSACEETKKGVLETTRGVAILAFVLGLSTGDFIK